MKTFLGVDGGGSKTRFVLIDESRSRPDHGAPGPKPAGADFYK